MRQTAKSARLPGCERADVVAAQHLGAAARREPQRVAGGQRLAAAASARDEQRVLHVDEEVAALVRRAAVDAEPDAHVRIEQVAHRRDARAEPQVGGRAVRDADARPRRTSRTSASDRWTQCAHHTSSAIQPTRSRYSTGVQSKSSRQYASSSIVSARCVCSCRPSRRASAADSSISRVVTENGEHGATAICTRAPSASAMQPFGVGEDRVDVLDERVGRQAAVGLAEVHRAARRDDAHAELLRRADLRLDETDDAAREDVVMVEDGRAARAARARRGRTARRRTPSRRRCAPTPGRASSAT